MDVFEKEKKIKCVTPRIEGHICFALEKIICKKIDGKDIFTVNVLGIDDLQKKILNHEAYIFFSLGFLSVFAIYWYKLVLQTLIFIMQVIICCKICRHKNYTVIALIAMAALCSAKKINFEKYLEVKKTIDPIIQVTCKGNTMNRMFIASVTNLRLNPCRGRRLGRSVSKINGTGANGTLVEDEIIDNATATYRFNGFDIEFSATEVDFSILTDISERILENNLIFVPTDVQEGNPLNGTYKIKLLGRDMEEEWLMEEIWMHNVLRKVENKTIGIEGEMHDVLSNLGFNLEILENIDNEGLIAQYKEFEDVACRGKRRKISVYHKTYTPPFLRNVMVWYDGNTDLSYEVELNCLHTGKFYYEGHIFEIGGKHLIAVKKPIEVFYPFSDGKNMAIFFANRGNITKVDLTGFFFPIGSSKHVTHHIKSFFEVYQLRVKWLRQSRCLNSDGRNCSVMDIGLQFDDNRANVTVTRQMVVDCVSSDGIFSKIFYFFCVSNKPLIAIFSIPVFVLCLLQLWLVLKQIWIVVCLCRGRQRENLPEGKLYNRVDVINRWLIRASAFVKLYLPIFYIFYFVLIFFLSLMFTPLWIIFLMMKKMIPGKKKKFVYFLFLFPFLKLGPTVSANYLLNDVNGVEHLVKPVQEVKHLSWLDVGNKLMKEIVLDKNTEVSTECASHQDGEKCKIIHKVEAVFPLFTSANLNLIKYNNKGERVNVATLGIVEAIANCEHENDFYFIPWHISKIHRISQCFDQYGMNNPVAKQLELCTNQFKHSSINGDFANVDHFGKSYDDCTLWSLTGHKINEQSYWDPLHLNCYTGWAGAGDCFLAWNRRLYINAQMYEPDISKFVLKVDKINKCKATN